MIAKFLWGAGWRSLAFAAVVGTPLWYANRGRRLVGRGSYRGR